MGDVRRDFREVVAKHIGYNDLTRAYDQVKAEKLAAALGYSKITVIRWISGRAKPPEEIKRKVMEYIEEKKVS